MLFLPNTHLCFFFVALVCTATCAVLDVGILLPLSSPSYPPSPQWKLALQLVESESGQDSYNLNIVLHIKDSGGNLITAITRSEELVTEGVQVVIGEVDTETSQAVHQLFSSNKIPQIVPLSPSTLLLDTTKYPYLIQTSTTNAQQAKALVSLIYSLGWRRCTPIVSLDDYGTDLSNYLKVEAGLAGVTLWSTIEFVPGSDVTRVIPKLKAARSSVFVLLAQPADARNILVSAFNQGLVGEDFVWIGSDTVSILLSNSSDTPLTTAARGVISLAPIREDRNASASMFAGVNTRLTTFSSGLSSLNTVGVTRFYDALKFIESAAKLAGSRIQNGTAFLEALKAYSMDGVSGRMSLLPSGGFSLGNFDILNYQLSGLTKIGSYYDEKTTFTSSPVYFSGSAPSDLPQELRICFMMASLYLPFASFAKYAVDQANKLNKLNYTLSLITSFPGRNSGLAVAAATNLSTTQDILAVIGTSASTDSMVVAPVFSNYKIPMVSFAATSEELSDKTKYPFFMRDIPSDGIQGLSIAQFIKAYGWSSCAIIASNDLYGVSIMNNFLSEASKLGITVISQQLFFSGSNVSSQVGAIQASRAVIIVAFAVSSDMARILTEGIRRGMMGVGHQWITTEAGQTALAPAANISANISGILVASPSFDPAAVSLLKSQLALVNQTSYPGLDLTALFATSYPYYLYDAVFMIYDALYNLTQRGINLNNGTALLQQLYATQISGVTGTTNIDSNGNRIGYYQLDNWNGVSMTKVAVWNPNAGTTFYGNVTWMGNGTKPVDVFPVCTEGQYLVLSQTGASCSMCPNGTFNPIKGATVCLPCAIGSFSDSPGQSTCESCAPGYFQAQTGATNCSICSPGSFTSETQQSACILCEEGTYTDVSGTQKCTRCPLGEYAAVPGSTACVKCPSKTTTVFMGAISHADCGCEKGTYISNSSAQCMSCPEGGSCEGGSSIPLANSGFWSSADEPALFLRCVDKYACPGGPANSCSNHYTGKLCAHCEEGYTFRKNGCHECGQGVSALFAIAIVVGVIVSIVMVHFLYSDAYVPYSQTLGIGTSIAIIISHFQLLGIFGIFNSRWPSPLVQFLQVSSLFNIDLEWISLSCYIGKDFITIYSVKLLLPLYFGVICMGALLLNKVHKSMIALGFGRFIRNRFPYTSGETRGVLGWIKRRLVVYLSEYKPINWRTVVNSFAAFLDLAYIYLISTAFEVFQCYSQPDGTRSLLSDASITCFSPEWVKLLPSAIISLVFYGIGVPVAFAIILYKGQGKTQTDQFHRTFGYFTQRYRHGCYWWQMVAIIRKFLLAFLIVTFAVNPETQFTTSITVMFIGFIAQLHFSPFAIKVHNRDEAISLGALLLVLIGGLLLFIPTDESFRTVIGILIILIVCAQVLLMIWSIYILIKTFPERTRTWDSTSGKEDLNDVDGQKVTQYMENVASEEESQLLSSLLYRVVAYNRYHLATPSHVNQIRPTSSESGWGWGEEERKKGSTIIVSASP